MDPTTQIAAEQTPQRGPTVECANEQPAALPEDLDLRVEAALMSTDRPQSAAKLSKLLGEVGAKAVQGAIQRLNEVYSQSGRSFRVESVAGGWQILTLPAYGDVLAQMHRSKQQTRLSPAAMEALAIIAFKQPILRAQIEAIREGLGAPRRAAG